MPIKCDEVREQLDAWALGALDAAEEREVDQHLKGCGACTLEADAAREAAAMLAVSVPLHAASDTLKARVMAAASALRDQPAPSSTGSRFRYWPAAAAAVAIIGLGLGGWGVSMRNQLNDLEDDNAVALAAARDAEDRYATVSTQLVMASDENIELTKAQDTITEIVSQPDVTRQAMTGAGKAAQATGRYVWSTTAGMGALVARNLPTLADGRTYCLWFVYESSWVLAGTFDVADDGTGRLIVEKLENVPVTAGGLEGYAVSEEPTSNVEARTGEIVLRADIP